MIKVLAQITAICLLAVSCQIITGNYNNGRFSEEVARFQSLNTIYDDYNSAATWIDEEILFFFSSNRSSQGDHFDIVDDNISIYWDMEEETLDISTSRKTYYYLRNLINISNSTADELGPYLMSYYAEYGGRNVEYKGLLMFANDEKGNYDIKFVYDDSSQTYTVPPIERQEVHALEAVNSSANDLYPTFFGTEYYSPNQFAEWKYEETRIETLIFCSDREGTFDLYQLALSSDSTALEKILNSSSEDVTKLPLNSTSNDKCPSTNGNLLVFTSDRPGGFGGFDLYYSNFIDDNWTEPVNFGPHINTSEDEYRPIVLQIDGFENHLMIFSSNRSGGVGGYDLYYVGIDQEVR